MISTFHSSWSSFVPLFTHPCMQTHKTYYFPHWKNETDSTKLQYGVNANSKAMDNDLLMFPHFKAQDILTWPHLWCISLPSIAVLWLHCSSAVQLWHELVCFFQTKMGKLTTHKIGNTSSTAAAWLELPGAACTSWWQTQHSVCIDEKH